LVEKKRGLLNEVEEEAEEAEEEANSTNGQTAITHLFCRLAQILRREPRKPHNSVEILYRRAETLYPKSAALQLIAALCTALSTSVLNSSMDAIMLPLVHLVDPEITAPSSGDPSFADAYNELVSSGTELMDLLQRKLGTIEYVKALQRVKKQVHKRRDERRQKRKIEAVSMPEKAERGKQRKRDAGKARRKEQSIIARGKRRGW